MTDKTDQKSISNIFFDTNSLQENEIEINDRLKIN